MGATHELRANFRRYRYNHPQYRLLFVLLDLVMLLVNLALFAGFLFVCWYIINRSSLTQSAMPSAVGSAPVVVATSLEPKPVAAKLSEDRIALLKSIAGQTAGQAAGQKESIQIDPTAAEQRPVELLGSASNVQPVDGPLGTVVQLEAANAVGADDLPTIGNELADEGVANEILELPEQSRESDIEGTVWVLDQFPNNYTVQIALTVNRPFLVDFARQLPAGVVSAIYPEQRNSKGSVQYSLSVGNFPTRGNAAAYLATMSDTEKRYGAHLRTFKEIQVNASKF